MNDILKQGELSGLRVLDLSRVLAGPWSGQLLAELDADVVKIERPGAGDDTRSWGPPWLCDEDGVSTGESVYFLSANRIKWSVTIDISRPEGQSLVKKLACKADVVIENFKVGGLAQYGLDYASLKALNPRLIYCSITGFGQTGPHAPRAGYDFLMQGMGGLMSLTGREDGAEGEGPLEVGVALTDIMTGLYATVAILAALSRREHWRRTKHRSCIAGRADRLPCKSGGELSCRRSVATTHGKMRIPTLCLIRTFRRRTAT